MFFKKRSSFFVLLYFWLYSTSPGLGELDAYDPEVCSDKGQMRFQEIYCREKIKEGLMPFSCSKYSQFSPLKCCIPGFVEVLGKCKRKFNPGIFFLNDSFPDFVYDLFICLCHTSPQQLIRVFFVSAHCPSGCLHGECIAPGLCDSCSVNFGGNYFFLTLTHHFNWIDFDSLIYPSNQRPAL